MFEQDVRAERPNITEIFLRHVKWSDQNPNRTRLSFGRCALCTVIACRHAYDVGTPAYVTVTARSEFMSTKHDTVPRGLPLVMAFGIRDF